MSRIGIFFFLLVSLSSKGQLAWPSENWTTAAPLTSVMNPAGLLELSGLHWNPELNRLYVVHGDGRLRVLQLDTSTNTFTQIGNKSISEGPEGITQANYSANEFYTIDENNYEIRKFTHTANFSAITYAKHWDLLAAPSPMQDTGNTGPEGIVFVPDASLATIGFLSSVTGQPYTSVKGAGGLFFIAHQNGGYIWVFDINPNVNNDFAYVGKYKTAQNESCDLAFDRSTGLLYILHNLGSNYIEVTDLTYSLTSGEAKFNTISEYFVANPTDGNINIEGFAITPKCPEMGVASAWLCRDVESSEANSIKEDVIRWFSPFVLDGDCEPLLATDFTSFNTISIYPNPGTGRITIKSEKEFTATWINTLGQSVLKYDSEKTNVFNVSSLQSGIYIIEVRTAQTTKYLKWIKN
jgi:hypothetical protein